jgi:lipopolysaccharide transport system permease protein
MINNDRDAEVEQYDKFESQWTEIISPHTKLLDLRFAEIWRYRDLLLLFVKRDFVAQYKQTVLGPIWHIIQPLFTTIIFLLVFGKIANIPTDGIQPILFYMSGITIWNYFSACLTNTANTFVANANIFGKVYFPRMVLPLSIILSNIVRFGIQFGVLLVLIVWYQFHGFHVQFSVHWIWIPVLALLMAGIGLGLGIIISSLTTKYRDLALLLAFAIQLAMYATPVAYPLSFLNNKNYRNIIAMNPLTPIVEAFRYCLFGKGTFTLSTLSYSAGFMIIVLFVGVIIFNKVEKSFMDTV